MKKIVPRKIFPEVYDLLRRLVFFKNKSYIQILEEVHIMAILKIETQGIEYYYQYKIPNSSYLLHKSISLPGELNEFLMEHSSNFLPAKHLLSAMIQDFIIEDEKTTDK